MKTILLRLANALAWVAQGLLDILAAITGFYYSRKYAAIVKRLGLTRDETNARRGFVAIELDGLAYAHLRRAMVLGYAPYTRRLLHRGEFTLHRWHTGLPCTTPASQAGIMYGNNEDIPAFRWYDKQTRETVVCKLPSVIQAIQERISAGRRGILKQGSSIVNTFDGDASSSMFTLGSFNRKHFFESVRGYGFSLLFLLNPFRAFRMLALIVWESLVDLAQRTLATLRQQTPRPLERGFGFLRVVSNVVFREIQTFAVLVDIYRGVPAIYTTYCGYDELAHHFGPHSKVALRALRALDGRIRQIDKLRRAALTRPYDLYILSDHGMTPAFPFEKAYGKTLGAVIRDCVDGALVLSEGYGNERDPSFQTRYLLEELAFTEANLGPALAHIPRKIRRIVSEHLRSDDENLLDGELLHSQDIVVSNSGSLSHVYLNVSPKPLDLSAIAQLCPRLIGTLVAHPGIWLVIGRENDQVIVMSRTGVLTLGSEYQVEGRDPLAMLPRARYAAEQLQRLAHFAHAGDLILMGYYDPANTLVASFEPHWACHGGLGGPQDVAFLMTDADIPTDLATIANSCEIYPLFARYAPDESASERRETAQDT